MRCPAALHMQMKAGQGGKGSTVITPTSSPTLTRDYHGRRQLHLEQEPGLLLARIIQCSDLAVPQHWGATWSSRRDSLDRRYRALVCCQAAGPPALPVSAEGMRSSTRGCT